MNNSEFRNFCRALGKRWFDNQLGLPDFEHTYPYLRGLADGMNNSILSAAQKEALHRLMLSLSHDWIDINDSADALRNTGRDTPFYGVKVAFLVGQHIESRSSVRIRHDGKELDVVGEYGEKLCLALLVLEHNDSQAVMPAEDAVPHLVCWSSESNSVLMGDTVVDYVLVDSELLEPELRQRVLARNGIFYE